MCSLKRQLCRLRFAESVIACCTAKARDKLVSVTCWYLPLSSADPGVAVAGVSGHFAIHIKAGQRFGAVHR